MRAPSVSLSPWRVWFPYCSGLCLSIPVQARAGGRPCVPAGRLAPPPADVTVGAGGPRFVGAERVDPVVLGPGRSAHLRGKEGGGLPWPGGGVQG